MDMPDNAFIYNLSKDSAVYRRLDFYGKIQRCYTRVSGHAVCNALKILLSDISSFCLDFVLSTEVTFLTKKHFCLVSVNSSKFCLAKRAFVNRSDFCLEKSCFCPKKYGCYKRCPVTILKPHLKKIIDENGQNSKEAKVKGTIPHQNKETNNSSATHSRTHAGKAVSNSQLISVVTFR